MRKIVLCAFALLLVGVLWAGGEKSMDPAAKAQKLKAELNLSAEQTAQVEAVLREFAPRFEAIRKDFAAATTELAKNDLKAGREALMKEQSKKLKATFTEEQKAKYKELMKAQGEKTAKAARP
ncbi:MAG: hypothetical protein HY652_11480 [Acidobacteria bacterium]|nr:hypothetical protein [Acidobacteriota bacterium]